MFDNMGQSYKDCPITIRKEKENGQNILHNLLG